MKRSIKRLLALCLALAMLLSLTLVSAYAEEDDENSSGNSGEMGGDGMGGDGMGGDGMGGDGMGGGGDSSSSSSETYRITEGEWSFILTITDDERTVTITSWDKSEAEDSSVVIVPAYLGGGVVTAIASTAFSRADEVDAIYLPSTIETISNTAFYDLNGLEYISCANPDVSIADGALSSVNGQEIQLSGTEVSVTVVNGEAATVAGGSYIVSDSYSITTDDIVAISVGTYTVSTEDGEVIITFEGDAYEAVSTTKDVVLADSVAAVVEENDFKYTFHNLSDESVRAAFVEAIESGNYADVSLGLDFSETGYYLNGGKVELEEDCVAYDAATGEVLPEILSTGETYLYVAYVDDDGDGEIDALYYTDGTCSFVAAELSVDGTVNWPENELTDGKDSASSLAGKYLAFANGVLEADGVSDVQEYESVVINNTTDFTILIDNIITGVDAVLATTNLERSILWANDYGSITIEYLYAVSTSTANWAQECFEAGDTTYNYELNMQYGLNAGLYATNGGQIIVGDLDGETSYVETYGDTGNGVIAIGGGSDVGSDDAAYATSSVYVYNTVFNCQGWNSHVVDTIYGGYVYLEQVTGTTGILGSYLGQSSALANDFGAGTIEVVDSDFTVYGNGSAGAYCIGSGSGTIKATNTNFTSFLDSGLCSAGGTFDITGGTVTGIIGFRARAGGSSSTLTGVALVKSDVDTNYSYYTTGDDAFAAAEAWAEATGDSGMPGPEMSNLLIGVYGTTLGDLCDAYEIDDEARETLYAALSEIAGETYDDDTLWRCSVLDSSIYGHPVSYVGKLVTASTDYSEVPYLNTGVGAEGLQTSSIIEFQGAGLELILNDCTVAYADSDGNYEYLIVAEDQSSPVITFNDCEDLYGIIWNEGDKDGETSTIDVTFNNSNFTGNFADGDYGLWEVDGLSYENGAGETSSLNGNYYAAEANWGTTATFDSTSTWTVTSDSYVGSLTLADGAVVTAADGYEIAIYVDVTDIDDVTTGTEVDSLTEGTYENVVILVTAHTTHTLTYVEAVDATETTDGNIAYYICEICGTYFDTDGNEIDADSVVIPATGTDDTDTDTDDTDTNDGGSTLVPNPGVTDTEDTDDTDAGDTDTDDTDTGDTDADDTSDAFTFADDDGTGAWAWASDAIYDLYNAGIIGGYEDSTYRPDGSLTRAEAAKIIALAYDLTLTDAAYETFSDDDGSGNWTWASEYIYACVQAGIINGYTDGTFLPDQEVTRAEMAKMIAIAEGISSDASVSSFTDVSDSHWALQYIEACADAGLIQGIGNNKYAPDADITRAQMAVLIARAIG